MKVGKYYNRDQRFTEEEKRTIAKKSNDKCCHCGKPVFFHYGATVDHFIPLDKGGTNSMYNLIMLCDECNQEKDNKIESIDYIPYLKDKYKNELSGYVDNYIQVMDYVQRNRLLAYDEYKIPLTINSKDYKKHRQNQVIVSNFKLKLATWNDLDRLHTYLVKYLKKYDSLDDEDVARENIIFWMQFGCIYYIEQANEISMILVVTIKRVEEEEGFRGINYIPHFYLFPYYVSDKSISIAQSIMTILPQKILEECNLEFLPCCIIMLENDKMFPRLSYGYNINCHLDEVNGFIKLNYIVGDVNSNNIDLSVENMNDSERKTYEFLKKFDDVTDKMIKYFEKYADRESVGWMIHSILPYSIIKNTELSKYIDYVSE